ncbi:MAG: 3-phosphoshikimate 1-carboxyvinyltransferase [Alphaproteobacteria bacterium]
MQHSGKSPFVSLAGYLKGSLHVPGDKSISHRALIISSQLFGKTTIKGLLEGDDVMNTAKALGLLGVSITRDGANNWLVHGVGVGGLTESPSVLDMGNSGTAARLMMGLVTPYPFATFFIGDESLSKRPMARVIKPLEEIGAKFTAHSGNRLPLTLQGTANPKAIHYELPVASAQVKSAILLAALNVHGTTTVIESHATRDHTENMLRYLGYGIEVKQEHGAHVISISGKQNIPAMDREIIVPSDPSSAAFPAVAALICPGSEILLKNICVNPLRTGLFTSLHEMGGQIEFINQRMACGEHVADIRVCYSKLKGAVIDAKRAPSMIDEYLILAVAAAFAEGETVMHGLGELRVKESDRLAAIIDGLSACGVKVFAEGESLHVIGTGKPPKGGATITTNFDHRVAMSFLIMGMASEQPVTIDDAASIQTSFPNFVALMNGAGAKISVSHQLPGTSHYSPIIIAVDGPAASGKGTLARRLAEHYGFEYLDTGSLYRAVGLKLVYGGKDPNDKAAAIEAAKTIDADDLANPRLRQERIGQAASIVSAFPEVRAALLEYQQNFAIGRKGAVLDGRDIGTVVCPNADFKFFITATLYTRAKRRHKELEGEGIEVVFDSVLEDLRERDERDSQRAAAPLIPADDAILMDTSTLDASEVFEMACRVIDAKG